LSLRLNLIFETLKPVPVKWTSEKGTHENKDQWKRDPWK